MQIDDNVMSEMGLGHLSDAEKAAAKSKIDGILKSRIGDRLMSRLTEEQLDHFESFVMGNDMEGGLKWLEQNAPEYKEIVGEEFVKIIAEVHGSGLAALA